MRGMKFFAFVAIVVLMILVMAVAIFLLLRAAARKFRETGSLASNRPRLPDDKPSMEALYAGLPFAVSGGIAAFKGFLVIGLLALGVAVALASFTYFRAARRGTSF